MSEISYQKIFTRIISILSAAVFLSLSLTGCGSGQQRMMFGTGGTSGTYYAYGGILAQYMSKFADVKVTAVSTGGSKVNIQSIADGDFQLSFAQSDVINYAWNGTNTFKSEGASRNFRAIGGLYDESFHLISMKPDIKSIKDLKGRSVSIGEAGSGIYFNAVDLLENSGIGLDDIIPQYLSFNDSKEALKDGKIDAAFIVAGAPTTAITELATTNGVNIISLENDLRMKVLSGCPYYAESVIPAHTYPGQDEDVETLSAKAVLIVDENLDEDTVYKMTAAIFDHMDDIASEHAKGAELKLSTATDGISVPFHKGAARYFAEHNIIVDTDTQ